MNRAENRETGAILVIVLWAVAALSIALVEVEAAVGSGAVVMRSLGRVEMDKTTALSGLEIAAGKLLTLNPEARWIGDGRPYVVPFGNGRLSIRIWDAGAMLDINRADPALMTNFFRHFTHDQGAAQLLAARIEQRRGGIEFGLADPGAAVGFASGVVRPVEARHPLRSEVELATLLRRGDVLSRVMANATVYGRTGAINPGLAPFMLIESVPGITREEALAIMAGRRDGAIRDDDAKAIVAKFAGYFDSASNGIYRVEVAWSGYSVMATMILDRNGQAPYRILSWRDAA